MTLVDLLEAIADDAKNSTYLHGGFVAAIVDRDYRSAAFNAGSVASVNFCQIVKFREWLGDYGDEWGREYIRGLRLGFVPGNVG